MMRLKSDLAAACLATLDGSLDTVSLDWDERAALGVVMAAGGYPGRYEQGHEIIGLENADSATQKVFHAGTALDGERVVTAGGRVLCVVGLGDSVRAAAVEAYDAVNKICWEGVYLRRDIGHRAIARENA
jgi:phosphoribosylamine--glycine ligase